MRAVIFDMDGVLTDSEPLICAAACGMFLERGLAVRPDDFLPFVGAGENRYIGGVAEKYGMAIDIGQAKARTYELYLRMVPERLAAFPGAVDLVLSCREAGLPCAVASSADRIKIDANLRKIGLPPEMWQAVVTAEDVERRKPDPALFLKAAERLGAVPSECTVVEDAVNGIAAAKAAGMRCVAVASTFPAGLLGQADLVRASIVEVTLSDLLVLPASLSAKPSETLAAL
ncbi:MAG: HAD-IA family hydrolase [bacterium]